MKLKKEKHQFGTVIILNEEDKFLKFIFGGNGDLYWSICFRNENHENYFVITKENYGVYRLFCQLYDDIENINVFDEEVPFYLETEEEKMAYLCERKTEIEQRKERYRLFNYANYNELFDKDNKTITWYSDETNHKVANILKIKREEDSFRIEFYIQPNIDDYDNDFNSGYYIPIRFRNSGSSYGPFNIVFMQMYNDMTQIDDTYDVGHQIHIEEYLYIEAKKLVKEK